jgi:hypothetical protein
LPLSATALPELELLLLPPELEPPLLAPELEPVDPLPPAFPPELVPELDPVASPVLAFPPSAPLPELDVVPQPAANAARKSAYLPRALNSFSRESPKYRIMEALFLTLL